MVTSIYFSFGVINIVALNTLFLPVSNINLSAELIFSLICVTKLIQGIHALKIDNILNICNYHNLLK